MKIRKFCFILLFFVFAGIGFSEDWISIFIDVNLYKHYGDNNLGVVVFSRAYNNKKYPTSSIRVYVNDFPVLDVYQDQRRAPGDQTILPNIVFFDWVNNSNHLGGFEELLRATVSNYNSLSVEIQDNFSGQVTFPVGKDIVCYKKGSGDYNSVLCVFKFDKIEAVDFYFHVPKFMTTTGDQYVTTATLIVPLVKIIGNNVYLAHLQSPPSNVNIYQRPFNNISWSDPLYFESGCIKSLNVSCVHNPLYLYNLCFPSNQCFVPKVAGSSKYEGMFITFPLNYNG